MNVLNNISIKTNAEEFKKKVHADIGVSGVADKVEKVLHLCYTKEKFEKWK